MKVILRKTKSYDWMKSFQDHIISKSMKKEIIDVFKASDIELNNPLVINYNPINEEGDCVMYCGYRDIRFSGEEDKIISDICKQLPYKTTIKGSCCGKKYITTTITFYNILNE